MTYMTEILLQTSLPTGLGGGETERMGIIAMDVIDEGKELALVLPVPDQDTPQSEWNELGYYVVVKSTLIPQYLRQRIIVRKM